MNRIEKASIITGVIFCGLLSMPAFIVTVTYVSLIPVAAAIATVYFGLIKYWIDADLIFKSLFKEFNERFDLLNEDLNNIVDGKSITSEYTENQVIQNYLNLCAEEYYWFTKGRIPKVVWKSWSAGIGYYLQTPAIKQYFKTQQPYNDSYYGFLNSLN